MATFFKIVTESEENLYPKVGGGVFMPDSIAWPLDDSGHPMLHLLTMQSNDVNKFVANALPLNHFLSVFIPYKKGEIEYVIDLARKNGIAKVYAYEATTKLRQECITPLLPAKSMEIYETDDDEEDEFSDEVDDKIGGHGIWLQNRIEIAGKFFLLQLLGATINRNWPSHNGIFMGGVGYLFVSNTQGCPALEVGEFKLQYT